MRHGRLAACVAAVALSATCGLPPQDPEERLDRAVDAYRRADLGAALAIAEDNSKRFAAAGDLHWSARFDLFRAEVLLAQGEGAAAERLIAGAYEATRTDASIRARWQYLRGYAASKRGDFDAALATLDAAYRSAVAESLSDLLVDIRNLQGDAYDRLYQSDHAEQRWTEALTLAEAIDDPFERATAHLNLGVLRIRQRRFDEAMTHFERVKALAADEGNELLRNAADNNISLCWARVGDLDRALEVRLDVIEKHRRAGVRKWLCQALGELGILQRARGETDAAIEALRSAVRLALDEGLEKEGADWAIELARTLVEAGRAGEATPWIEAARTGYRDKNSVEGLAEVDLVDASMAAALGEHAPAIEGYRAVAAAFPDVPELAWRAHAGLAAALRRTGQDAAAASHFAEAIDAVREAREQLFRIESRLAFLTVPIRIYRDYVALLLQMGREDEALAVIEASRAQTLLDGLLEEPDRALDLDTLVGVARRHDVVLVSYWISPRGSFAWVIGPDRAQRVPIEGAEGLDALVASHRAVIEEGWRDPLATGHAAGRELYRRLVAPLHEVLPWGSRVIIVPDGSLHAINFETLIAESDRPHYLIEDVTLSVAPALTPLAVASEPIPETGRSVLLVGDPDSGDPAFPRLPNAARELDAIATRLPDAGIEQIRGSSATPAAFLATPIERFDWIHFAAHAQASSGNPLDSSIILSPDAGGAKLYGRDIVERRLTASLVTLSACRSAGSRRYSGEGLVGFAWAFMRAGSSKVVAGLWDVSDRSTVLLMEELYGRLARGESAADALRAAKLSLLETPSSLSKPYYWGGFQLYVRSANR